MTWDYAGAKGGLGRLLEWLHDSLKDLGAQVSVGSPHTTKDYKPLLPCTASFGEHWLFSILLPFVLQRWIDTHKITHLILPGGPGGVMLLRKPKRCTVIVYIDHTYAQQSRYVPGQKWKRIFTPLEHRTYTMADQLLSVSQDTTKAVKVYYGFDANTIIPIGCDAIDQKPKEKKLCVYVGRLMSRKGTSELLQSWKEVKVSYPDARLVIIGDGPLRSIIAKDNSITWHPALSHEEVLQMLGKAQMCLCPFYLEGHSLVCSESQRCGTAVVGFDADGIRCQIDQERSGILTPLGDVHSFARAIVQLLADEDATVQMGTYAQRHISSHFSTTKAVARLQEVFDFS
ncbi:MAG: glycosyltransferase family 4 protein [bacterium]|nr:glycosyltransferase family 4 protein [bacterium]